MLIETGEGRAVVAGQVPYDHAEWDWILERSMLEAAVQNFVVGDPETHLASAVRVVDLSPRKRSFHPRPPITWRQRY